MSSQTREVVRAPERFGVYGGRYVPETLIAALDDGHLAGILAESDVLTRIVAGHTSLKDTVAEAMFRKVRTVHLDDDASVLTKVFADGFIGVVVDDDGRLKGILTKMDLVDFLTSPVETPS